MNVQADNPLSVLVDFYIRWHSVLLDEALYHKLCYCNKIKNKYKKTIKIYLIYEYLPIIVLTSCRWCSSSIQSIIFYWIVWIIIWFWFRHISVWFIWYTTWNLYELWFNLFFIIEIYKRREISLNRQHRWYPKKI